MTTPYYKKNPRLFVLGKTRVGKGEFIQTAVRSLTSQVLGITSEKMVSHTKRSAGYPIIISGRAVEIVDTVGYDDTGCGDACEKEFLKLLESTGTAPYYPPLVIFREMAGSDVAWWDKIRSVFPSAVCAIRCKTSAFEKVQDTFDEAKSGGIQLFHLHEFLDARDDDGISKSRYVDDVHKICEFYGRLVPRRDKLDFSSQLFWGENDYVKIRSETKTEEETESHIILKEEDVVVNRQKIITVDAGGHFNIQAVRRDSRERMIEGLRTFYAFGSGGWSKYKTVMEWVRDTKQIAVNDPIVQKARVVLIEKSKIRVTFKRDHYEVWKVLAGGIRVFREFAEGEWQQINRQVIEVNTTRQS